MKITVDITEDSYKLDLLPQWGCNKEFADSNLSFPALFYQDLYIYLAVVI